MLGLTFSATQEYTRTVTSSDSPVNSAVGGAAAGALLFASHGGNPVLGAAILAALSTVADMALGSFAGMQAEEHRGWYSGLIRKTSDDERQIFLEQRRKRILRQNEE
jgi:hypothetical protein